LHEVKRITSTANPLVKEAVRIRTRRSRFGSEAFLIEGPNLVEAVLSGGSRASVQRLFFTHAYREREGGLLERFMGAASAGGGELVELGSQAMERLCDVESPQGIAAIASYRPAALEEVDKKKGPVVISDGISDPGNMGSMIRAADASGASAVVLIEGGCDPFSPKTLRASAGSVFNVPLVYVERDSLAGRLRSLGLRIVAAAPLGGKSLFDADLRPPLALVFGNESSGISQALMDRADLVVSIPLRGRAESLNVAASAAVMLYESLRQAR
jgi:TrmH family RNA methyltransferase